MQVGVDVTYMYTNFGGCDLSGFGDIGTFKNGQISPSTSALIAFNVQLVFYYVCVCVCVRHLHSCSGMVLCMLVLF